MKWNALLHVRRQNAHTFNLSAYILSTVCSVCKSQQPAHQEWKEPLILLLYLLMQHMFTSLPDNGGAIFHGPVFSSSSPRNLILRQSKCALYVCYIHTEREGEMDEEILSCFTTRLFFALFLSFFHPLSVLLTHTHHTSNHAFIPSN